MGMFTVQGDMVLRRAGSWGRYNGAEDTAIGCGGQCNPRLLDPDGPSTYKAMQGEIVDHIARGSGVAVAYSALQ